jgi:hypothetical protein
MSHYICPHMLILYWSHFIAHLLLYLDILVLNINPYNMTLKPMQATQIKLRWKLQKKKWHI